MNKTSHLYKALAKLEEDGIEVKSHLRDNLRALEEALPREVDCGSLPDLNSYAGLNVLQLIHVQQFARDLEALARELRAQLAQLDAKHDAEMSARSEAQRNAWLMTQTTQGGAQ